MCRRCIVMVADGGRADLMSKLLEAGDLPNIQKHITDRGCYRNALTVFPSTTGPAHIPFVCGVHPGTANIPGYRWLSRETHDRYRRSITRHRSLNSPRGMCVGRDLSNSCTSLFEHFENPSSVFELIDLCRNQNLYKVRVRRLYHIVRAHRSDNWDMVDKAVERLTIERINANSQCIISSFFCIDEYSHLYGPFDRRTVEAYRKIDHSIGNIVNRLKERGVYEETILAVVSDHGLTATHTHIPVVDIVRSHGFDPYRYPKMYCRRYDSAVMESGNSMCMLYFKRGKQWGKHWQYDELRGDSRTSRLMSTLVRTPGISFLIVRSGEGRVTFVGRNGSLVASFSNGRYAVLINGESPLPDHPAGSFDSEELMEMTFDHLYPDAVNQAFMLFRSPRSGDILISSDPGYDLRLQFEDPEHFGSHGSLHCEHMKVPFALSVPFRDEKIYNYDLVPTILKLCGKEPENRFDGQILDIDWHRIPSGRAFVTKASESGKAVVDRKSPEQGKPWLSVVITMGLIISGIIIIGLYQDRINEVGRYFLEEYGQSNLDIVLFLLTMISSSPLMLPIWGYCLAGVALGYSVWRLAIVMALGSAFGSFVTYWLARYFGGHPWIVKKFPVSTRRKWTEGKSRRMVAWLLFIGTVSPIPVDVIYVACGVKRFPASLFLLLICCARFVRYMYLGYIFYFFPNLFKR